MTVPPSPMRLQLSWLWFGLWLLLLAGSVRYWQHQQNAPSNQQRLPKTSKQKAQKQTGPTLQPTRWREDLKRIQSQDFAAQVEGRAIFRGIFHTLKATKASTTQQKLLVQGLMQLLQRHEKSKPGFLSAEERHRAAAQLLTLWLQQPSMRPQLRPLLRAMRRTLAPHHPAFFELWASPSLQPKLQGHLAQHALWPSVLDLLFPTQQKPEVKFVAQAPASLSMARQKPASRPATSRPALAAALKQLEHRDWRSQREGQHTLYDAGRASIPLLLKALRHPYAEVRRQAALLLGRLGPGARMAYPYLKQALVASDQSPDTKRAIKKAIVQIFVVTPQRIPQLRSLLKHSDPKIRKATMRALLHLGPAAIDAIASQLQHTDPKIQGVATLGLSAMAQTYLRRFVVRSLTDTAPTLRLAMQRALLTPEKDQGLRALSKDHQTEHPAIRAQALLLLGHRCHNRAWQALHHAASDQDWRIRSHATLAIQHLPTLTRAQQIQLRAITKDQHPIVRAAAKAVLQKRAVHARHRHDTTSLAQAQRCTWVAASHALLWAKFRRNQPKRATKHRLQAIQAYQRVLRTWDETKQARAVAAIKKELRILAE